MKKAVRNGHHHAHKLALPTHKSTARSRDNRCLARYSPVAYANPRLMERTPVEFASRPETRPFTLNGVRWQISIIELRMSRQIRAHFLWG